MPPAVAAAAITAGAAIGGALLSNRANNQAGQRQDAASREALAFERERDAADRAERARALQMQEAQHTAREQARRDVLRHYGIFVPENRVPAAAGAPAGGRPGAAAPVSMYGGAAAGIVPLEDEGDEPLVDAGNWNQWATRR